jgi:hypothetical protein
MAITTAVPPMPSPKDNNNKTSPHQVWSRPVNSYVSHSLAIPDYSNQELISVQIHQRKTVTEVLLPSSLPTPCADLVFRICISNRKRRKKKTEQHSAKPYTLSVHKRRSSIHRSPVDKKQKLG